MSAFLDRVAKAIAGDDWHELPAPVREVRRHEARAASAAMREPSEAMETAGANTDDLDVLIETVWKAMIDAALRESWD